MSGYCRGRLSTAAARARSLVGIGLAIGPDFFRRLLLLSLGHDRNRSGAAGNDGRTARNGPRTAGIRPS